MKKNAVIVAGGKGLRMQSAIAKQYQLLDKKPVLMHSIEAFFTFDPNIKIVLALPEIQFDFWKDLCHKHQFSINHSLIAGGKTRFHSVKNALEEIKDGLVAIHDGVRPLVSQQTIQKCFELAEGSEGAIPVADITDSLRFVNDSGHKPIDRNKCKIVQTPQVFWAREIKQAYQQEYQKVFTDDATVFEAYGKKVVLIQGNPENIKITQPLDLALAGLLLKKMKGIPI